MVSSQLLTTINSLKEYWDAATTKWIDGLGIDGNNPLKWIIDWPVVRDFEKEAQPGNVWMQYKLGSHRTITIIDGEKSYTQRFMHVNGGWIKEANEGL